MNIDRVQLERKIFKILEYIENKTLLFPLKQNISLFSINELKLLLDFLNSSNLKPIYILLDSKYKEYLGLLKEMKHLQVMKKINIQKIKEKNEQEIEEKELIKLLNFKI